MADAERQKRRDDLNNGLTTPNRVLESEDRGPVPWGDVPSAAVSAFAREHPEWVMENWGGIENVPEPASESGGLFDYTPNKAQSESESKDLITSETTEPATPDEYDSAEPEDTDEPEPVHTDLKAALESKDPLRNERAPELPDLKHIVDATTEDLARVILEGFEDVEKELEQRWPDEDEKGTTPDTAKALAIDFDSILDTLDIRNAMSGVVMEGVRQSMQESAETEAGQLMSRIEDELDDPDASLIASFNVEDTLAFEQMQQFAAQDMVTVEDTVKEQVRTELVEAAEDGTGVQGATERLRSKVDEVSDNHARLVARTETLQASRHGQQALQESSDAIAGKQWRATQDSRVRPWHEAMDGEIVPVDESFTVPAGWEGEPDYQPSDYPKEARVVGEDSPFNCRCSQESILKDEMPEGAMEARDSDLIEVRFIDAHRGDSPFVLEFDLSERQFEVREQNKDGDEDFATVWKRVRQDYSLTKSESELGVSKRTVQKWDEQVGV
jgi:SPP1 gp7 family putative phage head morphogenesis protein